MKIRIPGSGYYDVEKDSVLTAVRWVDPTLKRDAKFDLLAYESRRVHVTMEHEHPTHRIVKEEQLRDEATGSTILIFTAVPKDAPLHLENEP